MSALEMGAGVNIWVTLPPASNNYMINLCIFFIENFKWPFEEAFKKRGLRDINNLSLVQQAVKLEAQVKHRSMRTILQREVPPGKFAEETRFDQRVSYCWYDKN